MKHSKAETGAECVSYLCGCLPLCICVVLYHFVFVWLLATLYLCCCLQQDFCSERNPNWTQTLEAHIGLCGAVFKCFEQWGKTWTSLSFRGWAQLFKNKDNQKWKTGRDGGNMRLGENKEERRRQLCVVLSLHGMQHCKGYLRTRLCDTWYWYTCLCGHVMCVLHISI